MRPLGWGRVAAPTRGVMLVLELTISDARKRLLLANPDYVPYLVDSLLLDPEHPRSEMAEEAKVWLQSMHTECLAQLALFPPGRTRLLDDSTAVSALETVAESGWSHEAQDSAKKALVALRASQSGTADGCGGKSIERAESNAGENTLFARHLLRELTISRDKLGTIASKSDPQRYLFLVNANHEHIMLSYQWDYQVR